MDKAIIKFKELKTTELLLVSAFGCCCGPKDSMHEQCDNMDNATECEMKNYSYSSSPCYFQIIFGFSIALGIMAIGVGVVCCMYKLGCPLSNGNSRGEPSSSGLGAFEWL